MSDLSPKTAVMDLKEFEKLEDAVFTVLCSRSR